MGETALAEILPPMTYTTVTGAGALTVAGQWRSFTAFPSILAIMVVKGAAQWLSSRYAMERFSMTSTFIAGLGREVKTHRDKWCELKVRPAWPIRFESLETHCKAW